MLTQVEGGETHPRPHPPTQSMVGGEKRALSIEAIRKMACSLPCLKVAFVLAP